MEKIPLADPEPNEIALYRDCFIVLAEFELKTFPDLKVRATYFFINSFNYSQDMMKFGCITDFLLEKLLFTCLPFFLLACFTN